MFGGLIEVLKNFVKWLLDVPRQWVETIFAAVWAMLPADLQVDLEPVKTSLEIANHWMPMAEMLFFVSLLWSFQGVFIAVKMILKLIPTVG
jgi:hypothetical protein